MGQPFLDLSQTIPSEIRVAVVAQPVSTEKKKLGYTFKNQGCSGCSTSFNHSWISPKLYLRKSGLQWLLNRFQPKKKIGVYLRKSGLQWLLNQFQPFLDLSQTIPSEIRVAVVAQPVSTIPGSLPNYTFGNQGCSGCSTGFNQKKIWVYLRKSGLQWLLNLFQPFLDLSQTIPLEIRVAVVAQPVSTEKKNWDIPSDIMVAVVAQPVSTVKKNWGIPSEIRVA